MSQKISKNVFYKIKSFTTKLILQLKHFRIAVNPSMAVHFLTTKVCHIARRITMPSVDHCALAARSQSPVAASPPCSGNSTPNILCALSAWSSSIKELSRSKTISHIVTRASRSSLAKHSATINFFLLGV